MKLFKMLMFISIFLFAATIHAEDYLPKAKIYDGTSIGIGSGQDFGGIGLGVLHYGSFKYVGFFGGLGYTPAGIGFNGGIKARLKSSNVREKINPFVLGMYGYTSAISITNESELNKLFYGPTLGVGIDFKFRPFSRGFWTMAFLFPVDKTKARDYIQYLKTNRQIIFPNEMASYSVSFGYRYLLN